MQRCEAEGIRARRIDVDYASHSAQVDAIREGAHRGMRGIELTFRGGVLLHITGELMDTAGRRATGTESIRQPVQFERRPAFDGGYRVFVPNGPHGS